MSWFDRFMNRKKVTPSSAVMMLTAPQAQLSPRDYRTFSEDGYRRNVVAYQCIERITGALSAVPLCLKKNSKTRASADEIYDHPVLELLKRPNAMQSYQAFVKSAFGYFMISGNNFMQAVGPNPNQQPLELWNLRPDRMKVLPGKFQLPSAYEYLWMDAKAIFPVDVIDGSSAIMHMKTFHPLNDWYGMSPLEAAAFSVDTYNASGQWNLSLLQNSGRPSGALMYKGINESGQSMSEEQIRELKLELESQYTGARNSGRPFIFDGGLEWKEMGINPKDMDWVQGKNTTARDVSLAFGVPPQLLGIPGDSTFSNYKEAKLAFYLDTIIPLLKFWTDHLNHWLIPSFEEDVYLEPEIDGIEALEPMRQAKWTQIQEADFLTINEKREQLGYGRYKPSEEPADKILVGSGLVPIEVAADMPEEGEEPTDDEDFQDPKKPNEDGDEADDEGTEDEEGDGEESDEKPEEEEEPKNLTAFFSGKAINLGTRKARDRYRRMVVRKRQQMANAFEAQLRAAWAVEAKTVAEAVDGVDIVLIEYTVSAAIEKCEPRLKSVMTKNITKIMKAFGKDVLDVGKLYPMHHVETKDSSSRFESYLQLYVSRHVGKRITGLSQVTKRRVVSKLRAGFSESLQEGATPQDMVKDVKEAYKGFTTARAATIVRTETGIAQNESQRAAAKALGIPDLVKTWISDDSDTARVNHQEMNDVSVQMHEKFAVPSDDGNDMMDGPGDPDAPGDQVINCKCVNVFGKGKN